MRQRAQCVTDTGERERRTLSLIAARALRLRVSRMNRTLKLLDFVLLVILLSISGMLAWILGVIVPAVLRVARWQQSGPHVVDFGPS